MLQVNPSPGLTLPRLEPASSESPHASGSRAGRVAVSPRAYARLSPVVSLQADRFQNGAARFVDVPSDNEHVIVERPGPYDNVYEVRSRSGPLLVVRRVESDGAHLLARIDGYYEIGVRLDWSSKDTTWPRGSLNASGELLATRVDSVGVTTLVASPDGQTADHPYRPDYIRVAFEPARGSAASRQPWALLVREPGVGAIDASGHTVMALESGRYVVLQPGGDDRDEAIAAIDARVDPGATDLSLVPPYAMILYGGGGAGKLADSRSQGMTTSHVDARRPDGSLAWRASLPFLPTQPPIDGEGRIYLVGAGIVALSPDGHVLWSSPSPVPLRAQAFADGTLALVRGSELQIVSSDGTIRQSLRAAEEITSYPAIGPDGAVWVASATTLYVAR